MGFIVKAIKSVVKTVVGVVSKVIGGVFGFLVGGNKSSKKTASVNTLNKTLDPEAYRKAVLGRVAGPLDQRYWEVWGTNGTKFDEVIVVATHQINAFKELYFEDELGIDAAGAVQGKYVGALTRATRLGAPGQTALPVGAGQYDALATFDGCAAMALSWLPDEKKLPNGIPNRYTQVIEGALVYDPRRDSTVPGGSGTHRITDQTTWAYATLDGNGVPIGRNNALQTLWYLLGWRIPTKDAGGVLTGLSELVFGRGVDPTDINLATFIAGANACEAAGYYTDIALSSENTHTANEAKITCDGLIGQLIDPGGLWSYYANVDDTANVAVTLTDQDVIEGVTVSWNPSHGMSDQYTGVVGKYVNPSATTLFQAFPYPMVRDATYEANLGKKVRKTQDFEQVLDSTLAQRLARLFLNQGQYQGEWSSGFNYRALLAQAWSVVRYTSERHQFDLLFRVWRQDISSENGIAMLLKQIDPSIWTAGTVNAALAPAAGTKYDASQLINAAGVAIALTPMAGAGGTLGDGFTISWTAPPTNVRRTEIRYRLVGTVPWLTDGPVAADVLSLAIGPLFSGAIYEAAVRHISIHEVPGGWISPGGGAFALGTTGNVNYAAIAAAGGTATWPGITGAGKPQDNADVTLTHVASAVTGQTAWATRGSATVSWHTELSDVPGAPALIDTFNYASVAEVEAAWAADHGAGCISLVNTNDTGGKGLLIGDNAGDDHYNMIYRDFLPYNPSTLYEIGFDIEVIAANVGTQIYAGVDAVDRNGNHLGNSYNYITLSGINETTLIGRNIFRSYVTGLSAITAAASPATIAAPKSLPDGSISGFGAGGTVKIRPIILVNYLNTSQAGQVIIHAVWIKPVSAEVVTRSGGGNYTGELAADVTLTHIANGFTGQGSLSLLNSAAWASNISGRPTELTDGRVAAGFDSSGDLNRNLVTSRLNSSNVLRWTGGALYAGELTADTTLSHISSGFTGQTAWATRAGTTVSWATEIGSRPTELTDGRVASGLNSSGDLNRDLLTSRRNSSNLLGYTGGATFSGELAADVTGAHIASGFTGQQAIATSGSYLDVYYQPGIVEIAETINYASISTTLPRADTGMTLGTPGVCSLVNSTDTNSKMLEIGDNAGNDYCDFYLNQWMPYDLNCLYEVIFDMEFVNVTASSSLYLGVDALDRAGNRLGGSFNYVAEVGATPTVGRRLYKAYLKGSGPSAAYHGNSASPSTPTAPQLLPDGTGNGFGAGGTVKFRPMGLINYPNYAGKVRVHSITVRRFNERAKRFDLEGVGQDNRILTANTAFSLIPTLKSTVTISDTDNTGTVTINIGSAVFYPDQGGTVTFPSGSAAGKAYGTIYFIKRTGVHPITSPTGTGWDVSTTLSIGVGEVYVNYFTTRATGGTPSPPPPPPPGGGGFCVAIDSWLPGHDQAELVTVGMDIRALDYATMNSDIAARVIGIEFSNQSCVEIVTACGYILALSKETPVTIEDGSTINVMSVKGQKLPIGNDDGFEQWDEVIIIREVGNKPIAHIHAGGATYAAGKVKGRYIYTHNTDKP